MFWKYWAITDLGSLIGNFEWIFHSWKFSHFLATLILQEINFCWFQKVKNWRFNNFECFEFWFFRKISHLKMLTVAKNSTFRAAQIAKMGVLRALKITKIDFTLNLKFPHWVFPIRLPRFVGKMQEKKYFSSMRPHISHSLDVLYYIESTLFFSMLRFH